MDWQFGNRAAQPQGSGEPISVEYTNSPGLLGLCLKNFLLNVVTLSIYRFWAKTNVRRHVWSNIKVNGQALEYTGTGLELFLGALVIFLIIGVPLIVVTVAAPLLFGPNPVITGAIQFVLLIGFLMLFGMAIYRARRYRLSRTLWRGIRGTLAGSSVSFSFLYFGAMLLKVITLGWAAPAMNLNIQQRMIGDMSFGDRTFSFSGPAAPLYARFALCWVMSLVAIALIYGVIGVMSGDIAALLQAGMQEAGTAETPELSANQTASLFGLIFLAYIGIAVLWTTYVALEMNMFARYTSFDNAQFNFNATALSLIGLWFGNLLIMIFTFSIGQPYVMQRTVRYLCNRLTVEGTVDVAAIQQSTAAIDKRGEGLVEAFDIDAF